MYVSKDYDLPIAVASGQEASIELWALESLLTGQIEGTGEIPEDLRWVVVQTCDSTQVSATDLFGATYNAAKWVHNDPGDPHSWGVWRNADSTRWMILDCRAATAGLAYRDTWITFCDEAPGGGTTTDAPNPNGESFVIKGLGNEYSSAAALAHLMMNDDGDFLFAVTTSSPTDSAFGYGLLLASDGAAWAFDAGLSAPGYTYTQDTGLGTEAIAICNRAILRCGQKEMISSLSEDSEAARLCNAVFALCRDEVLAEADWPFARRSAVLSEIADHGNLKWTYGFALPADYIATREIFTGVRRTNTPTPYAVELRAGGAGHMLLTDEAAVTDEAPYLTYTARVESPSLWHPYFSDALAWRIAMDIALALSGKADVQRTCAQMYEIALSKAETSAAEGEALDPNPSSEFVTIRS